MTPIPVRIRARMAELGSRTAGLSETRAAEIGRALAMAVAEQIHRRTDPTAVLEIYGARIEGEAAKAQENSDAPLKAMKRSKSLSDTLETFGAHEHYRYCG